MTRQEYDAACARRLAQVEERMKKAAREAGHPLSDIALIAVSKLHPATAIKAVAALGQTDFGENYLEEAMRKQAELAGAPLGARLHWHFIGHLQSRKAREAAGRFALIHTVDSLKTARRLQAALEEDDSGGAPRVQRILIQVNVGREAQKSGVDEDGLLPLAEGVLAMDRLHLEGLMCIPPFFDHPEGSRPYFRRLRQLRDDLAARLTRPLPHLSMGMSLDFEVAIAEGATLIRVGTDIFGPRETA